MTVNEYTIISYAQNVEMHISLSQEKQSPPEHY